MSRLSPLSPFARGPHGGDGASDWTFTMENSAVDFTVVPVSALKAAMAWRRRPPQSLRCCRPCSASCETLFGLGGKDSRRWRSALSSMKPASHPTAASTNASRRPSGSPPAPAATPRGHPPGSGCMRRPAEVLAFSARRARGSRQLSSAVHSLSAAAADCTSSFRTTGASRRLISSRKLSTPCS